MAGVRRTIKGAWRFAANRLDAISRRRGWLVLGIVWIGFNALIYFAFPESPWTRRANYKPRRSTLRLYHADEQLPELSECSSEIRLKFRLMRPLHESDATRYPLVVFLHGAGEVGSDNQRQLNGLPEQMAQPDWRRAYPCFVLAPQCRETTSWSAWMADLERLVLCVREKYPVDPQRIYLTGLSMGGAGCWELAAQRPDLFAAVVPICGGGDVSVAARLKDVPIWAVHGDADAAVPVEATRSMIQAIRDAGGKPQYSELAGVGHDSWTSTYSDQEGIMRWMFEQVNDR